MAILGFFACAIVLLYFLVVSGACIFLAMSFQSNKTVYILPVLGLCIDIYLWTLLIPCCPFTISLTT